MKKVLAFALSLFASFLTYGQTNRELPSFEKVSAQEGIQVFLKSGSKETARIETQDIDQDKVLTEINGSTLKIHLEGDNHRNIDVQVYVTYVKLTGVKASSAASIEVEDEITTSGNFDISCSSAGDIDITVNADDIEIDVSSSGDVDAKVQSNKIKIEVSSAGDIDISGKVQEAKISASSSGDIDGYGLICEKAELRASSGASINVTVEEELEARASSGSSIRYKGSPKYTDNSSSSGGSVRKS